MTTEEKELLLQDLCARLPYGVKVQYFNEMYNIDYISTLYEEIKLDIPDNYTIGIYEIKPYLRPMSSMTEEEKEELKSKCIHTETEEDWEGIRSDVWGILILDKYDTRRWDNHIWPSVINMDAIDWLNKKMFDYRGLIPMGLAIEVTEENNPYK